MMHWIERRVSDMNWLVIDVKVYVERRLSVADIPHVVEPVLRRTLPSATQQTQRLHITARHLNVLTRVVHSDGESRRNGTIHGRDRCVALSVRRSRVRIHEAALVGVAREVAVQVHEVALARGAAVQDAHRRLEAAVQLHDLRGAATRPRRLCKHQHRHCVE